MTPTITNVSMELLLENIIDAVENFTNRSVFVYNPDNNYTDDILYRVDTLIK